MVHQELKLDLTEMLKMFIKAVTCLILHKKIVFDSKDHLDFFMKSAVMSENRNVVLASKVNGRGHRLCAKNAA